MNFKSSVLLSFLYFFPHALFANPCEGLETVLKRSHTGGLQEQIQAVMSVSECPEKGAFVFLRQTFLTRLTLQEAALLALQKRADKKIYESESFQFVSGWLHAPQKKKDPVVVKEALRTLKKFADVSTDAAADFKEVQARCVLWDACEEFGLSKTPKK